MGLYGLGAIALGIVFGQVVDLPELKMLIPLGLFFMLYPMMLDIELEEIRRVAERPGLLGLSLMLNFLIAPMLMYGLGWLFLGKTHPMLLVGLVVFSLIPCGPMVPAFTGMARGNVNLAVSILTVSLLLCIGVVPVFSKLLLGRVVPVPPLFIFKYLVTIVIVPLVLAMLTRRILTRWRGQEVFDGFRVRMKTLTGSGLLIVIFVIFALKGSQVLHNPAIVPTIMAPAVLFMAGTFFLSQMLIRIVKPLPEDSTAFIISSIIKNNSVTVALVLSVFGPDAALANAVAGPMVQFPVALLVLKMLSRNMLVPGRVRVPMDG